MNITRWSLIVGTVLVVGCGDDASSEPAAAAPSTYTFNSRFEPGVSSVRYTGQTKRHLLIETLTKYLDDLDDQTFSSPSDGDVVDALEFFYRFNEDAQLSTPINFDPGPLPLLQATWADIRVPTEASSLVGLQEKFPEFDAGFDGPVVGYGDGTMTPEAALLDMFGAVEALVLRRFDGDIPEDPSGTDIAVAVVSAEGIDYKQLIQKYLGGAIALSQGADDYLDDDIDGKGLLSDNSGPVMGNDGPLPYTALEHVWDEGFGYFGAARNYPDFSDDEIASAGGRPDWQGAHDANGDDAIDLLGEHNFGHSVNAAKRDRGSVVPTDFTQTAFDAFVAGRTLIVNANDNLDAASLDRLRAYRDAAVSAWEQAIAATAVHYVNDVLQDMNAFGTSSYSFLDHAKHWSELKGFALALQFNVNHSPLTAVDLTELHRLIGGGPVLPDASTNDQDAYRADLNEAKALLGRVYQFSTANLGDELGTNGW